MKSKTLQITVIVLIFFSFFNFIFAQINSAAFKFDEFDDSTTNSFYSYYNSDELSFVQRVERFTKQLSKERGVTAYVIYYKARINSSDVENSFTNAVDGIKNQIRFNDQIKIEEVIIINGGYRETNTVEFWIVPKNAELPAPRPTLDKSETFVCPNIFIGDDTPLNQSDIARFSIRAYNFKGLDEYSLTWRVSGGEIIRGQGTNDIKVKLKDAAVKRVTAHVEVGGLPFPCPKVFSATARINEELYLLDAFGVAANGEIKARMDAFFIELQNNSKAQGYVFVYGNRAGNNRDAESRIRMISSYLNFRNFDISRTTIVRGGFRETTSTDLWLSFDGSAPVPTPTVNEKFVVVSKPASKSRLRKK